MQVLFLYASVGGHPFPFLSEQDQSNFRLESEEKELITFDCMLNLRSVKFLIKTHLLLPPVIHRQRQQILQTCTLNGKIDYEW